MILSNVVKVVINLFRDGLVYTHDSLDFGKPGTGNGARRTEMMQERLLAPSADARNLVER
jgi:hypothetical protein